MSARTEPSILERVIEPHSGNITADLARFLLTLDFSSDDQRRIAELSDKTQQGTLTEIESTELESFLQVDDFLSILQSKSRQRLKSC